MVSLAWNLCSQDSHSYERGSSSHEYILVALAFNSLIGLSLWPNMVRNADGAFLYGRMSSPVGEPTLSVEV